MTLFPSLTGSIRGKICWQWSAKGSGGSSLPAWAGVAFHPATWSLCPPQGRRPSNLVSPAWLLAEVQRWLQKALAFFQFSPAFPKGHAAVHTRYCRAGVQGLPRRAASSVHWAASLPKKNLQNRRQSQKHHTCWRGPGCSNSFFTEQRCEMGTPLTAVCKLVHAAQVSQFFHCVVKNNVVFLSAQVNGLIVFFPFFHPLLPSPSSRSPDPYYLMSCSRKYLTAIYSLALFI